VKIGRTKVQKLLPLLIFLFFGQALLAQNSLPTAIPNVKIGNKSVIPFKSGSLSFYNDVNKSLTIDKINHNKALLKKFVPFLKDTPNFGFATNDIWFLTRLQNSSEQTKNGFLEFSNPILDEIDLFEWNEKNNQFNLTGKTGDQIAFSKRPTARRNLLLPFNLTSKESKLILIRINNGGEQFHFELSYKTENQLTQDDYFHQFFFGIYFGILLFVLIFNTFMYVLIKDKTSKYYVLYILSLGVLQLSLNGFSKEFFWPSSDYLTNHINPIFASLGVFFLVLFTYNFLKLDSLMPRIARVFKIIGATIFINTILSCIPHPIAYQVSVLYINGVTLLLAIAIIPMALYAVKQKFRPGRFFALAFIALVFAVLGFVLKNFGLLPSNNFTNYGLQYGSALEVILLSIAIIDRFKDFKDTAFSRLNELNDMRQKANEVLEQKVEERTAEVNLQKHKIELQNEELEKKKDEILSSIEYAKRIQQAILPSNQAVNELLPKNGVLYLPKDIVAGDFYWVEPFSKQDTSKVFFAVGDCTGHGVPGAMVSVICHNALHIALTESQDTQTGLLLDRVDQQVKESFSVGNLQINDGMDVSLACWDKTTKTVTWSGANNALWMIQNDELIEYKANKQPIGRGYEKVNFTTHSIDVKKGDRLILFSDGYADQFGGELKKKFKSKNLKELLVETRALSAEQQTEKLHQAFLDWVKKDEQIDDVCIMIVEISE
jgi:serine phosphatase RsbU (regulator of sigma subunit)